MSWTARASIAIVLAVACATLPLVLDQCAASCEAHSPASASAPSCHHAASTSARVGGMPALCGHDHNGVATTLTVAPSPAPRPLVSAQAVTVAPPVAEELTSQRIDVSDPISPPAIASYTLALPLRL